MLYGLAPPKLATPADRLAEIVAQQVARLRALPIDGVVVYDIQDEAERVATPRPFPFLPTIDPEIYAHGTSRALGVPRVVYRSVQRDTRDSFVEWLDDGRGSVRRRGWRCWSARRAAARGAGLALDRRLCAGARAVRRAWSSAASPSPSGTAAGSTSTSGCSPRQRRAAASSSPRRCTT